MSTLSKNKRKEIENNIIELYKEHSKDIDFSKSSMQGKYNSVLSTFQEINKTNYYKSPTVERIVREVVIRNEIIKLYKELNKNPNFNKSSIQGKYNSVLSSFQETYKTNYYKRPGIEKIVREVIIKNEEGNQYISDKQYRKEREKYFACHGHADQKLGKNVLLSELEDRILDDCLFVGLNYKDYIDISEIDLKDSNVINTLIHSLTFAVVKKFMTYVIIHHYMDSLRIVFNLPMLLKRRVIHSRICFVAYGIYCKEL